MSIDLLPPPASEADLPDPVGSGVAPDEGGILRWLRHVLRVLFLGGGWKRLERRLVFLVPLAGYLVIAAIVDLHYHSIPGDAQSRLANAYYVFYSRDPHLAAIGFVWNPLASVSVMPLLLLKGVWPALSDQAFAGCIMSSLFMAGAAYQIYRFFEDLRVRGWIRVVLIACFVANPEIAYYGSNGMSEALFVFTTVFAARYFARWLSSGGLRPLLISGIMLGLAYADRNEALLPALGATVLVLVVSWKRSIGDSRTRRMTALTDAALFITPFAVAFIGWAVVSYIIVGHLFEQFSSVYGNSSQLKVLGEGGAHGTKLHAFVYASRAADTMAPLLPLVLIVAAVRSWRDRDVRWLAVAIFPGGVLIFELASYSDGQIFSWYRYFIYAVPCAIMLAGCIARPLPKSVAEQVDEWRAAYGEAPRWLPYRQRQRLLGTTLLGLLAVVLTVPGPFSTGSTILHNKIASNEMENLDWIVQPHSKASKANLNQYTWESVKAETEKLDALHLPHGAVMVDDFDSCIPTMLLDSKNPKQFTIPNDEDFQEKLGVPYQFGVRYFLVTAPTGDGALDALNRQFPTLYANGQGLATLAQNIDMKGCPDFRLYKLKPLTS